MRINGEQKNMPGYVIDCPANDGWHVTDDFILYKRDFMTKALGGLCPPCADVGDGFEFNTGFYDTVPLAEFIKIAGGDKYGKHTRRVESAINALGIAAQTLGTFVENGGESVSDVLFANYTEHPGLYLVGWNKNGEGKIFVLTGIANTNDGKPPIGAGDVIKYFNEVVICLFKTIPKPDITVPDPAKKTGIKIKPETKQKPLGLGKTGKIVLITSIVAVFILVLAISGVF